MSESGILYIPVISTLMIAIGVMTVSVLLRHYWLCYFRILLLPKGFICGYHMSVSTDCVIAIGHPIY